MEVNRESLSRVDEYSSEQAVSLVTRWYGYLCDLDEVFDLLDAIGLDYKEGWNGGQFTVQTSREYKKPVYSAFLVFEDAENVGFEERGALKLKEVGLLLTDAKEPGLYGIGELPKRFEETQKFWNTLSIIRPLVDEAVVAPLFYPVTRFLNKEKLEDLERGVRHQLMNEFRGQIELKRLYQSIRSDTGMEFVMVLELDSAVGRLGQDRFIKVVSPYLGNEFNVVFKGDHTF